MVKINLELRCSVKVNKVRFAHQNVQYTNDNVDTVNQYLSDINSNVSIINKHGLYNQAVGFGKNDGSYLSSSYYSYSNRGGDVDIFISDPKYSDLLK